MVGEMDDRDGYDMFAYWVAVLGVIAVAACTLYAVVVLAETLLSH
jgi:hypothetical protein